jgi:hypothetical protein
MLDRRAVLLSALVLGVLVAVVVSLSDVWRQPPTPAMGVSSSPSSVLAPPRAVKEAPEAPAAAPVVDPGWVRRTAARAGIPETALRAYAAADLGARGDCGVGWATLAGIGYVESVHGTIDGRRLRPDGRSVPVILGPTLDGGRFDAIRSTQASRGHARWDHAVGPMQFIPSSWERWATDGDGDREADPHDLDDAAAAAARYLCADGHDLGAAEGWSAAVFSYNHEQSYVDAVHAAASAYVARTS